MKRNENKVPALDEIIFENRNKEYGAYDLRRRYKSVAGVSIITAAILCTSLVLLFSLTTKPVAGTEGKEIIVVIQPENIKTEIIRQPEVKPPPELLRSPRNVAPKVVDSVVQTNLMLITDVLTSIVENGDLNDTVVYVETTPEDVVPAEPKIFIVVEEPPMFPGGENGLLDYIRKNTVYPAEAIENNIEGRVILKFVVTPDGTVGKIEILKGVDPLLDQEAIRVVSTLPEFKPGRQSGVPVSVWYMVPVLFQISR